MRTLVVKDGDMSIPARIILSGGLVAVPTETVYGLAANGLDEAAAAEIFRVKGRPEIKPLSLLVSGLSDAGRVCREMPDTARKLADAFWPGPLTMILKKRPGVPDIVTAGGDTVGVRCPGHPMTLELLRRTGLPLAAPSANLSGQESPGTAADVLRVFDGLIDCVIDGGRCAVGVESTILDLTVSPPRILRRGAVPAEDIGRCLNIEAEQ